MSIDQSVLHGPIKCRFADVDDVDFLHQNLLELRKEEGSKFKYSPTPEVLMEALFSENKYAECIMAEFNSNLVGFLLFSQTHHNFTIFASPGIFIHDIYVLKDFRRKGIAKELVDFIIGVANSRDCSRIDGILLKDNQIALSFNQQLKGVNVLDYIYYMRLNLK